jgi:hypothetical protein
MKLNALPNSTIKNESFLQLEYIKRELMKDGGYISHAEVRNILEGRPHRQSKAVAERVLKLANRDPLK